jgi:hypothetical protein
LNSLGEDDLINIRYKEISLNIKERWKVSLSLYLLLLEEVLVVEVRLPVVEFEIGLLLLLLLLDISNHFILSVRWMLCAVFALLLSL